MKFFPFKINPLFFTLLSGAIAGYFLITTLFDLWNYLTLDTKVPAVVQEWKVVPLSSSAYAINASYTFEFQGRTLSGQTVFSKPYHLNPFSAQQQIKKFASQPWEVWVNKGHPDRSSLEKHFPTKRMIYALMAVGVCLYFVYLRMGLL